MVALTFLCTNLVLGLTFGIYGPFVAGITVDFPGTSRSLLAGGLALVVTFMGLLAPVVGRAIGRWSIRRVMAGGLVSLALMLLLASVATSAWQFVAAFGLLGGVAAACLVIVPPTTLINNWFVEQRGKATGIVMIPFLVMAMPPVAAAAITSFGWRPTCTGLALMVVLLLPLTRLIVDRPADVGQTPLGAGRAAAATPADTALAAEAWSPAREPAFWATTYCGGIVAGAGVTISTHLVPYAAGAGHGLSSSAFLLTLMGGAGMAGGVLFGLLADRIGGARTLGVMCLVLALLWPALLGSSDYAALALVSAGFGLCMSAVIPVVATLFGNLYRSRSFAPIMGLYSLSAMPFGLVMPIVAGWLFDITASYRTVFLAFALLFAGAVVLLAYVDRAERAHRPAPIALRT
jgi:MFS family permease